MTRTRVVIEHVANGWNVYRVETLPDIYIAKSETEALAIAKKLLAAKTPTK